ncbi:Mitogen-activated protein kinase kinase kinase 1 [Glycine max]|nr:Mitogen-activated protein kinase kinase kinase 1 [Glycine max]
MGDCLNFLGMEDLKLLEEEMDKAAKVVRECKVDVSGQVKLADFGLAKVTKFNDVKSSKGSPYWMAPKVVNLKNQGGYRLAVDIWSLGCIVLEMLTRQPPYSDLEGVCIMSLFLYNLFLILSLLFSYFPCIIYWRLNFILYPIFYFSLF